MGSGTGENDAPIAIVIIHEPIVFDMAFDITLKVVRKPVFPAAFGQRFFPYKFYDDVKKPVHVTTALFHKLEVFFELVWKVEIKH